MSRLLLSALLAAGLAPLALAGAKPLQPHAAAKAYEVDVQSMEALGEAPRCPCDGYYVAKDKARLGMMTVPTRKGYAHREADLEDGVLFLIGRRKDGAPASVAAIKPLKSRAAELGKLEGTLLTVGDKKYELDPSGRATAISVAFRDGGLVVKAKGAGGAEYYEARVGVEPVSVTFKDR